VKRVITMNSWHPPAVPQKAKEAIAILLEDPRMDLQLAAKAVGITTYTLRRYLKEPHVRAYLRAEKLALLDAIGAGNPVALKDIRDNSENAMARVNAARGLEIMRNDMVDENRGGPMQTVPGLVVVIAAADGRPAQVIAAPTPPPVIDARPDEFGPAGS